MALIKNMKTRRIVKWLVVASMVVVAGANITTPINIQSFIPVMVMKWMTLASFIVFAGAWLVATKELD